MKRITVDNYKEFKPSEFVRSFVVDVYYGINLSNKTKKKINVQEWKETFDCLPCIGGLACMGLRINPLLDPLGRIIASLGDSIRTGSNFCICRDLCLLYPNYQYTQPPQNPIISKSNISSLKQLQKRIHMYVNLIEESGQ
jgi:hypothetical protein